MNNFYYILYIFMIIHTNISLSWCLFTKYYDKSQIASISYITFYYIYVGSWLLLNSSGKYL